jgi:para-nitrobenzyl esterase
MRTAALSGLFAVLAAGAGTAHADDPVQVKTASGVVRGSLQGGVVSFKGIPLAAPPVGALRWRPPQPVPAWSGVRAAVSYGPDCMQIPFPGDAAPLGVKPEEDCLYVNVWRPERPVSEKLPVMVWIYGGGFVNGGSSPSVYDGSAFARDGVVLVSFNYRLGNFGFFAHPALSAEQPRGPLVNYAFMDQIAALEWVQKNVATFGGDPHNVTLFGESAGGMSVHALMTSPLARGLFQKAIVESAGGRPGPRMRPVSGAPDSAEGIGLALAKRFGIEGQGPEALAKLRAIPADKLVSGLNMATAGGDSTYVGGPVVDGQLYVGAPTEAYAAGEGAKVPMMIGANSMDIGFMQATTLDELYAQFGPDAQQARSVYGSMGGDVRAVAFTAGGDQMMAEPVRAIARILAARGQPVFQFRFSYVAESMRRQFPGAFHATEIPFVFDTVAARYGKDLTPADQAAAHAIHAYWVAFARAGKPDAAGEPAWPAYSRQNETIMDFTAQGPVAGADPWGPRLDLAERLSDRREQAGHGRESGR